MGDAKAVVQPADPDRIRMRNLSDGHPNTLALVLAIFFVWGWFVVNHQHVGLQRPACCKNTQ